MREVISLRPLAEDGSDAAVMLPWLTDQRVLEWVYGRDEVYTLERIRDEWDPAARVAEHVWPHLITLGDRPIGYLQLVSAHAHNDCYQADGDLTHAWAFDMFIGEQTSGMRVSARRCVPRRSQPHSLVAPYPWLLGGTGQIKR